MKIIAITGSPKGKNSLTLRLVNAALDGAKAAGAETEIIDVARKKINYCKGCAAAIGPVSARRRTSTRVSRRSCWRPTASS